MGYSRGVQPEDIYEYEQYIKEFGEKKMESMEQIDFSQEVVCCPEPIYLYEKFKNVEPSEAKAILKELAKKKEERSDKYRNEPEFRRVNRGNMENTWEWSGSVRPDRVSPAPER